MSSIDYDGRYFVGVENYNIGDFTPETVYHYRQHGDIVWATIEGGGVLFGTLVAKVRGDNELETYWQWIGKDGRYKSGRGCNVPEILADGRIRFREYWAAMSSNTILGSEGSSVAEEVYEKDLLGNRMDLIPPD